MALLEVTDLRTSFATEDGVVRAVDGVSFTLERGTVLGIVGESGSGKSVTCLSLLRLTPRRGSTVTGTALLEGRDLLAMDDRALRDVRGRQVAMIFQDPMTSLNPIRTIGYQLAEAITLHAGVSGDEARRRSREMLAAVGIPNPGDRLKAYPMELSGGMRQRVMIAMALLNKPDLLIADEPTTALDVTTQAQVLRLLADLRSLSDSSIILITHDLGVIAGLCEEVLVMYAGRVVERAPVRALFGAPSHPYTWGLLASLPAMNVGAPRIRSIPGSPPSLLATPPGCAFHPRCPLAFDRCRTERPELAPVPGDDAHAAACHLPPERRAEERRRAESEGAGAAVARDPAAAIAEPTLGAPERAATGVAWSVPAAPDAPLGAAGGLVAEPSAGDAQEPRA